MIYKGTRNSLIAFIVFLMCSCTSLIGPYSPIAYQNATSLKAEVLSLLDKAETPYKDNQLEIASVQLKAEKAYEFVKGVPKNQLSASNGQY